MQTAIKTNKFQLLPFVTSLFITLAIAAVASLCTVPQIPGWYATLIKPPFNPPNQVFGPVWTMLYIMIAVSAYLVWKQRDHSRQYTNARVAYFIQLLLNFSWSIIFFGLHQLLAALIVIVMLWVSIIANMYHFGKFSRVACWLLLPYLMWVTFASILNFSIYMLNH